MTTSDPDSANKIDTGGGTAIGRDANTDGGDFAGRDKRTNSGETSGAITAQVVNIYNAPTNPAEPAALVQCGVNLSAIRETEFLAKTRFLNPRLISAGVY